MNKTNFTTIEFESTSGDEKKIEFSFTTQCEGAGVISVYSKPSWLNSSVSGKIVTLTTNSSTLSQRDGYVVVAVDGEPCDSPNDKIPVIQKTSSCSCGISNFRPQSLTWTSNSKDPQDIEYSVDGDCPINVIDATTDNTTHFSVTKSNGKITVTPLAVGGQSGVDAHLNIQYKANGVDCDNVSLNLTHEGSNCGCGTFKFDSEDILVWENDEALTPKTKGYTPHDDAASCITEIVPSVKENSHFNVVKVTNGIQVTPTASTTSDVNEDVTVNYKANGSPCTAKTFKIRHNGAGCSCAILSFKVDGSYASSIVWDSEASGKGEGDANVRTITYSIVSGKENCIDGSINVNIGGTDADKFGIDKTDPTQVKVWPIGENVDNKELSARVEYSYQLIDGTNCDGSYDYINITQIKGCKCKDIMPGQCYQKTVTKIGGNDFEIGSGTTQGCGMFTSRYKGDGVSFVHQYFDGNKRRFTVDLKNMSLSTKRDIVNDITIVFTKEYDSKPIGECSTVYTIIQTPDWISCDRLDNYDMTGREISYSETAREYKIWRTTTYYVVQAFMAYQNQGVITASDISSNKTWLHDFRIDSHYDDTDTSNRYYDIYATADPNDTGQDRDAIVTLTMNRDKLRDLGICKCSTYTKTFTVTQKASSTPPTPEECPCRESKYIAITYDVDAIDGEQEHSQIINHKYASSCFTSSIEHRFTLNDENGSAIDNCYTTYKTVPGYTWLSVKIQDNDNGDSTYSPKLYWKCKDNSSTTPRTGIFYLVVHLKDDDNCKGKIEVKQKSQLTCQLLKDSILSGLTHIPYDGSSEHSVAYTSELLVEGSKLSGKTTSSTASWVNDVHTKDTNDRYLYANVKSNISTANDGASSARTTTIKTFFVDSNGNKVKIGTEECSDKDITVYQNGFSGKCPSCDSVTIDDLEIMYKDAEGHYYGEEPGGCKGIDDDYYPAVHGGYNVELFKCKINKPTTIDHEGHTTTCFEVIPETTDGNLTGVRAVLDTSDPNKQTYIIKGDLKQNTGNAHVGVGMALYIGRKNYANNGKAEKCTTLKDAHIILLVNGKKCDYTPTS